LTGHELRCLRRDLLRLTQEELATKLELRRGTIGRYEREDWPIPRTVEYAVRYLERLSRDSKK
jgi:DNA-binding XRE family transcriptional regulator